MPPIDANQDDDQDTRGAAEDAEEAALREELIQMLKGADTIGATSEEAAEKNRVRYHANKEKVQEQHRQWCQKNPEKIRTYSVNAKARRPRPAPAG